MTRVVFISGADENISGICINFLSKLSDRERNAILCKVGVTSVPVTRKEQQLDEESGKCDAEYEQFDESVPDKLPFGVKGRGMRSVTDFTENWYQFSMEHPKTLPRNRNPIKEWHSNLEMLGLHSRHRAHKFFKDQDVLRRNHRKVWWFLGMNGIVRKNVNPIRAAV